MQTAGGDSVVVIGNTSDNPFAIDVSYFCGQLVDVSDVIALKDFQNTEFCPRFISDENHIEDVGNYLDGKKVVIVSNASSQETRNELAMRNMLIARAAKDNGAKEVVLVEPDLFYSCQDRGPRLEHSFFDGERSQKERKKFDGQAFTALLYSQLLSTSGIDRTVTIHNHSESTQKLFAAEMDNFHNMIPADLFAQYLTTSGIADRKNLILCAPDKGAASFVDQVKEEMSEDEPLLLKMDKARFGERDIDMVPSEFSDIAIEDVQGKDVVVFDDMVRTGTTIVRCCRMIKKYKPRKIIFCVTHFHTSSETREKLSDPSIDEILTTNTIPAILNRDSQGRLRKKIIVLKLERWIAKYLRDILDIEETPYDDGNLFSIDMSSKNPRWNASVSRHFQAR